MNNKKNKKNNKVKNAFRQMKREQGYKISNKGHSLHTDWSRSNVPNIEGSNAFIPRLVRLDKRI